MSNLLNSYIEEAESLQNKGNYEMAISVLQKAQQLDCSKEYSVKLEKLLSYNYRKVENIDMALYHINNAINLNLKKEENCITKRERAICLMNKGIIYEVKQRAEEAIKCYSSASQILISLYNNSPENYGIIINSLFTLGLCYYKENNHRRASEVFRSSLNYFDDLKETDTRYRAIKQYLEEISEWDKESK